MKLPQALALVQEYLDISILRYAVNFAFVFGMISLISLIWRFIKFIWRQCFRPFVNTYKGRLYSKYGVSDESCGSSWAVFTGGSDGIGLGMCKQLANEGFNICIVARNEDKMKAKIREIKKETTNKDLQTCYVVSQMDQLYSFDDFRSIIN